MRRTSAAVKAISADEGGYDSFGATDGIDDSSHYLSADDIDSKERVDGATAAEPMADFLYSSPEKASSRSSAAKALALVPKSADLPAAGELPLDAAQPTHSSVARCAVYLH